MKKSFRFVAGVVALVALSALPACSGEELTVGQTRARSSAIEPGAVYSGYVANYAFASGSDRVTIMFATATTGTLFFGDPPDGAPVDPTIGYAPWAGKRDDRSYEFDMLKQAARFYERYAFTIRDAQLDDGALRFHVKLNEYWTEFCAAQQSHLVDPSYEWQSPANVYSCFDPRSAAVTDCSFADGEPARYATPSIDCAREMLCAAPGVRVCDCDASTCRAAMGPLARTTAYPGVQGWGDLRSFVQLNFGLRFVGDEAHGSTELGELHFTRN